MIEVREVRKSYGNFEAVRGVSFDVRSGEIVGLLGPNGAGKTTIMKILTCYHFPTSGNARINSFDVYTEPVEVKASIGYLPENAPLYGELNVHEYLQFIAAARGIEPEKRAEAIGRAVDECGLEGMMYRSIDTLSKGYRQRVGLAQAIIHDPAILILDEPTTGLDPNQIVEIRRLIRNLGEKKTVILSTHILQEVEAVCDYVLILNEGRIAAQGTTAQIASELKGDDIFAVAFKGAEKESLAAMLQGVPHLREFGTVTQSAPGAVCEVQLSFEKPEGDSFDAGEVIFDWAVGKKLKIVELGRKRVSLEDVFIKLTGSEGEHAV